MSLKDRLRDDDDDEILKKSNQQTDEKKEDDKKEEEEKPLELNDSDDDKGGKGKGDTSQAQAQINKLKGTQDRKNLDSDEEDESASSSTSLKLAKHRHGWFSRWFRTGDVMDEKKLLSYKKSMIKKALLKQNRELDSECVQLFKNLFSYMGDRSSSKAPLDHAKKMLRNLMNAPSGLRDEAYMHVCKQTTENPKAESSLKGWEMMAFYLCTFPPSKSLKNFLADHISKAANNTSDKTLIPQMAKQCEERLNTILRLGQRKQVPSKLELSNIQKNSPISLSVKLVDGTAKTFNVDSYTFVKDVIVCVFAALASLLFLVFSHICLMLSLPPSPLSSLLSFRTRWLRNATWFVMRRLLCTKRPTCRTWSVCWTRRNVLWISWLPGKI
jgi:hypothetical protein